MNLTEYAIVIVPLTEEDGGGYAGYAPDLPGCMSDGATPEEATANTIDAIEAWLEANADMGRDRPLAGSSVQKFREREMALLDALRAAIDYADHADGRIAKLEASVATLLKLMQQEGSATPRFSDVAVAIRLQAPSNRH